jgi:AcrR family transcriptional regulator
MSAGIPSPRDRLLTAAEAQFRRFGYRRATIEDIAQSAGTGKGSLYLHFASKQAIYMAVVRASLERFVQDASRLLNGPAAMEAQPSSLLQLTIDHYARDELLHASLFGEASLVAGGVSKRAADVQRARLQSLLRRLLDVGQRKGTVCADVDIDAAVGVLFGIGWAVVRAALVVEGEFPVERALAALDEIVLQGLLPRNR